MNSPIISVEKVDSVTPEIAEAFQLLLPQLSQSAPPITRERLESIVAAPANTLFVARMHSPTKIVGALTVVQMNIPSGVRAWIEDVVVDQEARGHGVGDAMLSAAIAHVRTLEARTLDLTSNPTRAAAHRLYEKTGFAIRDTRVYRHLLGQK